MDYYYAQAGSSQNGVYAGRGINLHSNNPYAIQQDQQSRQAQQNVGAIAEGQENGFQFQPTQYQRAETETDHGVTGYEGDDDVDDGSLFGEGSIYDAPIDEVDGSLDGLIDFTDAGTPTQDGIFGGEGSIYDHWELGQLDGSSGFAEAGETTPDDDMFGGDFGASFENAADDSIDAYDQLQQEGMTGTTWIEGPQMQLEYVPGSLRYDPELAAGLGGGAGVPMQQVYYDQAPAARQGGGFNNNQAPAAGQGMLVNNQAPAAGQAGRFGNQMTSAQRADRRTHLHAQLLAGNQELLTLDSLDRVEGMIQ